MVDLAALDELVAHAHGGVDRYGEPDAAVGAAVGVDRGVDADEPAARVDECATRVAGVDGRVGLDDVDERVGVPGIGEVRQRTAQRGDDTRGDGVLEAVGGPDRDDGLTHEEVTGVAEVDGRDRGVHLDYRDVGLGVATHELGRVALPGGVSHGDLVGFLDDMVVREDVGTAAGRGLVRHAGAVALHGHAGVVFGQGRVTRGGRAAGHVDVDDGGHAGRRGGDRRIRGSGGHDGDLGRLGGAAEALAGRQARAEEAGGGAGERRDDEGEHDRDCDDGAGRAMAARGLVGCGLLGGRRDRRNRGSGRGAAGGAGVTGGTAAATGGATGGVEGATGSAAGAATGGAGSGGGHHRYGRRGLGRGLGLWRRQVVGARFIGHRMLLAS